MSNLSQNRQVQNPPQNELEKITEIQNLLQNGIANHKDAESCKRRLSN